MGDLLRDSVLPMTQLPRIERWALSESPMALALRLGPTSEHHAPKLSLVPARERPRAGRRNLRRPLCALREPGNHAMKAARELVVPGALCKASREGARAGKGLLRQ